jgi:hypothetical protein
MLPKQLNNLDFGFVKLGHHSKIPFEKDWVNKPYKFDDIAKWFAKGGNYGIICGLGDLVVIDTDNEILSAIMLQEAPQTFTVRTTKGFHFYYLSSTRKKKIIFQYDGEHLGELISCGGQVVGPLSTHPSGMLYSIERDLPIHRM